MTDETDANTAKTGRNLPVPVEPQVRRSSGAYHRVGSDFASQLIAARDQLSAQRARRRASSGYAIGAYAHGARIGERRVPNGYRLSVSA